MIITVTDNDINNWIRLAQTNETMMDALMKCATVYALALPDHNKIVNDTPPWPQIDPVEARQHQIDLILKKMKAHL